MSNKEHERFCDRSWACARTQQQRHATPFSGSSSPYMNTQQLTTTLATCSLMHMRTAPAVQHQDE